MITNRFIFFLNFIPVFIILFLFNFGVAEASIDISCAVIQASPNSSRQTVCPYNITTAIHGTDISVTAWFSPDAPTGQAGSVGYVEVCGTDLDGGNRNCAYTGFDSQSDDPGHSYSASVSAPGGSNWKLLTITVHNSSSDGNYYGVGINADISMNTTPDAPVVNNSLGTICAASNVLSSWILSGPSGNYQYTNTLGGATGCRDDAAGSWSIINIATLPGYQTPTLSAGSPQTVANGGQIGWDITYTLNPTGRYKCLDTNQCGWDPNDTGPDQCAVNTQTVDCAATGTIPTVTSPTATSITSSGATLGANVTSLGTPASITARGTCWGTTAHPVTNCRAQGGTTIGVFTDSRTGMSPSTTYYYRGYATNSTGTGYSADATFTTSAVSGSPDLQSSIFSFPTTGTVGVAQDYVATISNVGGASTGAGFTSLFQVNDAYAGGGTTYDRTTTTVVSSALAAGASTNVTNSVSFSSAGNKSIRLCADRTSAAGGGVIAETNESDASNCTPWSNVIVSAAPSPYSVQVIRTTGGTVKNTGATVDINCGTTCYKTYTQNSTVTLQAYPLSSYWKFDNWTGDCTGSGLCVLIINGIKNVQANFSLRSFDYREF